MRRTLSAAAIAAFVMLANAATAMAAGQSGGSTSSAGCNADHDVDKIGNCAQKVVSSNAKAFWIILLIVGLLIAASSRKTSRAVAGVGILIISGIAIWNPVGVGAMMSSLAGSVV